MKRRNFLKLSGLGAVALVASSCGYQIVNLNDFEKMFDQIKEKKRAKLVENIKEIKENIISTYSIAMIKGKIQGNIHRDFMEVWGEGLIFEDYILTVNHVVSFSEKAYIQDYYRKYGLIPTDLRLISENTRLKSNGEVLEAILREEGDGNGGRDMAIFKLPENYKKPNYKVKLGDSDKLKMYDEVHLLGDPSDIYFAPRPGRISSFNGEKYSSSLLSNGIIMGIKAVEGDSGSPVMNNDGEIVGIASISDLATMAFVPINEFKKEIKKYEASQKK